MRVPAGAPLLEVEVPRDSAKGKFCVVRWLPGGVWTGTCEGFVFTEHCKHIDKIRTRIRNYQDIEPGEDLL